MHNFVYLCEIYVYVMRRSAITAFLFILTFSLLPAQIMRPVPQDVQMFGKKTANLNKGVVLTDMRGGFKECLDFVKLSDKGVRLILDYGSASAGQSGVKQVPGAYRLEVTSKEIYITGYDRKGVYHGLHTLRHLMENAEKSLRVPCCLIYDWPDSPQRGVVEGYYGSMWPQSYRLSMIDLYGSLKMDKYIYAPLSDSFVSGEEWFMPYPEGRSEALKELISACGRSGLDFVWCIRPGKEFTWSDSDCSLLMGKFEIMYFLGVRSFGIFFDNLPESEDLQAKAEEMVDRINRDFLSKKKDVGPLLTDLTGYYVPKDDGESLRLSVHGYADQAWNKGAFDPVASLDWGLESVAPQAKDACKTFVTHFAPLSELFNIEESSALDLFAVADYSEERAGALMAEFKLIESVRPEMEKNAPKELYSDIEPWLVEFEKLGTRCCRILDCMKHCADGDVTSFWSVYAENLMSVKERETYDAHNVGSARLQPYYDRMMEELYDVFSQKNEGKMDYERMCIDGIDTYIAPEEAEGCYLVMNNPENHEVIVRLSDRSGKYVAEFCIDSSYFEFELKEDAIKVEIIGDTEVFETIFVNKFE